MWHWYRTRRHSRWLAIGCRNAEAAFPDRTIQIIVPFAPGGPIDAIARPLAAAMQEILGATVVVENRSGAGGITGSEAVAECSARRIHAPHDDGIAHRKQGVQPAQVRYDPLLSFTPVTGLIETNGIILVARKDIPADYDRHAQCLCEEPAEWPDLRPRRHRQHFIHRRGIAQAAGRHAAFRDSHIAAQPPP